jgi:uncharacterized protein YdaU (DUF1376 family)
MTAKKPFKVDYVPSDFLGGTIMLDAMEELAYRRICDLIYVTDDNLPDDRKLASLTKTGKRWPAIREKLLALGKIECINSRLSQGRCRDELAHARARISKSQHAAQIGVEKRKALKEQDSGSAEADPKLAPELQLGHQPAISYQLSANKKDTETFEAWWKLYPRKIGKGQAEKAYAIALKRPEVTPDVLLDRMTAWASTLNGTEPKYIPHASTWLNGRRWEDDQPPPSGGGEPAPNPERAAKFKAYMAAVDKAVRECIGTTDPRFPKRADFGLEGK